MIRQYKRFCAGFLMVILLFLLSSCCVGRETVVRYTSAESYRVEHMLQSLGRR